MGNLKEVAYDLFQPSIDEEQENVEPENSASVKKEKPVVPDNIKQGRPITIEQVRIDFPLKPYPAQVQMMSKIIHSLKRKENAVLESPTGSGKSLALLCATLAWRQREELLAIEKRLNTPAPAPAAPASAPTEVLAESNGFNKREREDINNTSNSSIDSDFQTQPTIVEKKPKYQDVADMEDFSIPSASSTAPSSSKSESPRRTLPPNLTGKEPLAYKSSLDKFKLENYDKKAYTPKLKTPTPNQSKGKENSANMKYETFNEIPRIFVGSRTHKQITQLVQELRDNTSYRPRMTVLASREQLCVHPKVSKSSTKADDCNALLEKKKCIYAQNTQRLVRHSDLKTSKRVWDIEDLVKLGKTPNVRACPYFAARKLYEGAEIIFCPYNYIIDPIIRSTLDIQIKNSIVIIDEAHNIEDSSRSAGSFEVNENELKILAIELNQIIRGGYEPQAHNHMLYFIDSLLEWVSNTDNDFSIKEYEQHVNVWSGTQLLERLEQLGIKATTFNDTIKGAFKDVYAHASMIRREAEDNVDATANDDLAEGEVRIHQRKCVSNNGLSVLQALIMIFGFFFEEGKSYSFDYRMALIKRIDRGTKKKKMNQKAKAKVSKDLVVDPSEWNYKLCFWCLNPGAIFRQLTDDTHSVILTSGTLSPMNTFESELETKFTAKLEANHVISPSQVWVGTIPTGPNNISLKGVYKCIESFQYQDDMGEALYQILEVVPFGVLCFFPSYGTLDKLTERWKTTGLMEKMEKKKLVLTEPRKSGKNDFEEMMKQYNDTISAVENDSHESSQTGALIFGVFRGKISEGIDFTDNTCRAVVSVGIPFPGLKDVQVNLKKSYNDQKKESRPNETTLSGYEWYTTQAYRAINQALGRCIRHRNDWGAIILLEERFQYQDNINRLSKWIKNQHKTYSNFNMALDSLTQFSSQHSRKDADARKALVEGSIEQFFKKEDAKVPINAFDVLLAGRVQMKETAAPPTVDHQMAENTPMVNNTPVPLPENTAMAQCIPVPGSIPLPMAQSIPLPEYTPMAQSIPLPENTPIVLSDDDDEDNQKPVEDEELGMSFDFDDIDLDALPDAPSQQKATALPTPVTSLPVKIPVQNTAQVVESIQCKACNRSLMSGFAKDRNIIPNTHPFSFISRYTNTTHLIELCRPGSWIMQDNLVGGPLGANVLPNKYKAEVDRNDRVCYRPLTCQCEASIGAVICDVLDGGNKADMGKVHLWQSAIDVTTRKPVVVRHTRPVESEHEYLPSSQQANMNDMFYNLP